MITEDLDAQFKSIFFVDFEQDTLKNPSFVMAFDATCSNHFVCDVISALPKCEGLNMQGIDMQGATVYLSTLSITYYICQCTTVFTHILFNLLVIT
jgi:hypothetical protein